MRSYGQGWLALAVVVVAALLASVPAHAQPQPQPNAAAAPGAGALAGLSATDIAKQLQSPIGDLTFIPLQNNTNFGAGPHRGTQNILNVEPIIPIPINEDWSLVTRTVLPLTWPPSSQPARSVPFGAGPVTFSAFLSPKTAGAGWIWRAGPVVQIPSATDATLGSNVWGAGPSAVVVHRGGAWVYGGLVNNVWSFGGTSGPAGTRYNTFLFQPFMHYNFADGWSVGTVPVITANWLAEGQKWTLPAGGQVERVIKLEGRLPVSLIVGAYYNVLRPRDGSTWQLRTQIGFVF